ncbi:MAG: HEPN domain-containing protein [Bacteroidota bacterium]
MPNRAADRFRQAEKDCRHAIASRNAGDHEWACFAAQQAAEKAVKALHLFIGQEAWGHVTAKLLKELPAELSVPPTLVQKAMVLDTYYIPPRYPDSHPEGAPFEHYGDLQSREAIAYAGEILEFVRSQMAGPARGS